MKKYELLENDFINLGTGDRVYRIKALIDFGHVNAGDFGGLVQKEENLDQDGNAWVYGNARVYGEAWVSGDARVSGNARVYGEAWVQDIVINLIFKEYSVTILREYIAIGGQTHTFEEWKGFTDEDIAKRDGADGLVWWHDYKDVLLKIWEINFSK